MKMQKALSRLLTGCLISLFSTGLLAQAIDPCMSYEWAKQAGGSGGDFAEKVLTDPDGSIYLTGRFHGSISFGSISLNSTGLSDVFVAKRDSAGNWLWAVRGGGTQSDACQSLVLDKSGHIFIAGNFQGTAIFGTDTLVTSNIYADIFVAKLDTSGNWLWVKKTGGPSSDYCYALVIDPSLNIYFTGRVARKAKFGNDSIGSISGVNCFLAKMDTAGNWIWAISTENGTQTTGHGLCIDASANIYLAGSFDGNSLFGTTQLSSSGKSDGFIAKLDSSGNWLWVNKAGGTGYDYVQSVTLNPKGGVYMSGYFSGAVAFGPENHTSAGSLDGFISKLGVNGNWLWTKRMGGTGTDEPNDLIADLNGDIYVTGNFSETADFGGQSLISAGLNDIFMSKLDGSGNWQWARRSGGGMNDYGRGFTFDGQGRLLTTGYFSQSATFGNTQLNSVADYDSYLARLSETILTLDTMTEQHIVCGSMVVLPGEAKNFAGLQWSPLTNLPNPNTLNPLAFPIHSTTYTLTAEDACGQSLSEQVKVNVIPYTVDAGNDTTINLGGSVVLQGTLDQSISSPIYLWTPSTGLTNPSVINPTASPITSTTYSLAVSTPNGCLASDSLRITVNGTSALNEKTISEFKIYPNPSTGKVNILSSEEDQGQLFCELIGQQGKVVMTCSFSSNEDMALDLGKLAAGMYFLRICQGNDIQVYKLVKSGE